MVIYSLFTISLLMSKSKKSLNNGDFFNNVINHRKKIHSHLKIFRFLHIKNFVMDFTLKKINTDNFISGKFQG